MANEFASALLGNEPPQASGNLLSGLMQALEESAKGVGQAAGIYTAADEAEKERLRKRLLADVISTIVGAGVSAVATPAAGLPASAALRVAMQAGGEAVAGAAMGGVSQQITEGQVTPEGLIPGAIFGGVLGGAGRAIGEGVGAARAMKGAPVAAERVAAKAAAAPATSQEFAQALAQPSFAAQPPISGAEGLYAQRVVENMPVPKPSTSDLLAKRPVTSTIPNPNPERTGTIENQRVLAEAGFANPTQLSQGEAPPPTSLEQHATPFNAQPAITWQLSEHTPPRVVESLLPNLPVQMNILEGDHTPTSLRMAEPAPPPTMQAAEWVSKAAPGATAGKAAAINDNVARRTAAAGETRAITSPAEEIKIADAAARGEMRSIGERYSRVNSVLGNVEHLVNNGITSSRAYLNKMGEGGQVMAAGMDQAQKAWLGRAAHDIVMGAEAIGKPFTPSERVHINRILEGSELPIAPRYSEAAQKMRALYDSYGNDAEQLGIVVRLGEEDSRPFRKRDNWVPHIYTKKTVDKYLTEGTPEYELAMQRLKDQEQGMDKAQAMSYLKRYFGQPTEFRHRNLQFARVLDLPGYEEDFLIAAPEYIYGAAKRLETARVFGGSDEVATEALKKIEAEGYDAHAAAGMWDAYVDRPRIQYRQLGSMLRKIHSMTMLASAGVIQPAQWSNTITRTGWMNFVKGMVALTTKEGRQWAESTGAALRETLQDVTSSSIVGSSTLGSSGKSLSDIFMRLNLLEPLDKANRLSAALAGRFHAEEMATKLMRNPNSNYIREQLTKMGIEPMDVISQQGILTNVQKRGAALEVANNTQFANSVLDLPAYRHTTAGQFIYLFKAFAHQQARFIKDEVLKPALRRRNPNLRPLFNYLAASGTIGVSFAELANVVKGKQPNEDAVAHYLDNLTSAGILGLGGQAIDAVAKGPDRFASFVAGPSLSEMVKLVGDAHDLASGNPRTVLRHAISRVPLGGPWLSNYLLPPQP